MHDLGEQRIRAHALGTHHQRSAAVHRHAGYAIAGGLGHRHRLPGDHRFIHPACAFGYSAVNRYFFAGFHAQPVADHHGVERHLFLGAVFAQSPRKVGGESQQFPDRLAGLAHGPQLQHVAQDDQCHDDCRCFEISAHSAVVLAEFGREQVGQENRNQAEQISESHAQTDQRIHVERAVRQRQPELAQDRPADPPHHGSAEHELDPAACPRHQAEGFLEADHR